MHTIRQNEIKKAAQGQVWGLVLGSLGRQGSPKVLEVIIHSLSVTWNGSLSRVPSDD